VPELHDLERPLHHRTGVLPRNRPWVVGRVEDHHQPPPEPRPNQLDGLLAPAGGHVDDDGVDGLGRQGRPGLEVGQLGDPAGAVEQRSEGETQGGVAS
jgi:hypothetical protein